jgi:hypothetical protein
MRKKRGMPERQEFNRQFDGASWVSYNEAQAIRIQRRIVFLQVGDSDSLAL